MQKTAVIVQARLGSTRLPAKVLLPLPTGRTVLEEVLFRCRQIPGVDVVVCAVPDTAENDILASVVSKIEWAAFPEDNPVIRARPILVRGSEHDVLARYAKAAGAVGADVVMRVTSDCPLIDPEACGHVLQAFMNARQRTDCVVHYSSNVHPRWLPHGQDCEVFSRELLERANREANGPHDREHVTTPWMYDTACAARACTGVEYNEDRSHLRWTLDTLEDYVRIWNIFDKERVGAALDELTAASEELGLE